MASGAHFIFAGGGTGGHLYPGLAIAERIRELDPDATVAFACSDKPLDARILTDEGVAFVGVPARPLSIRPVGLLRLLRSWGPSMRIVRGMIGEAKRAGRDVTVVAMGGYVAAPAAQAARASGVPLALVNLDAVPGKANRWIGHRAGRAWSAAEGAGVPATWARVGPIVRDAATATDDAASCRERLGLSPHRRTLLVTGGSQGATSINGLMTAFAAAHSDALAEWQVFHQAGRDRDAAVRAGYESAGASARVVDLWSRMSDAWGAADLAIGRAGAGTVAEAQANGTPTIFLPYPYHKDEHQRLNASPLADAGGAVILRDHVEAALNLEAHGELLRDLLTNESRRMAMRAALDRLGPAEGASRVARALLGRD